MAVGGVEAELGGEQLQSRVRPFGHSGFSVLLGAGERVIQLVGQHSRQRAPQDGLALRRFCRRCQPSDVVAHAVAIDAAERKHIAVGNMRPTQRADRAGGEGDLIHAAGAAHLDDDQRRGLRDTGAVGRTPLRHQPRGRQDGGYFFAHGPERPRWRGFVKSGVDGNGGRRPGRCGTRKQQRECRGGQCCQNGCSGPARTAVHDQFRVIPDEAVGHVAGEADRVTGV